MLKQIAALTLAASLGAGSATALLTAGGDAPPKYAVHGLDVRMRGTTADGGSRVELKVYARQQLLDGGYKDVGGHICPFSAPLVETATQLLTASATCIHERQ